MIRNNYLLQALRLIPEGASTDTKTVDKRLASLQPSFFVHGKGAYAQDPSGNWWLDCQMGLGAYILGYNDEKINQSVCEQIQKGSIFSLSSILEVEVASILINLFPDFEQVRFGKNGSDVTSAAIRISRSHTGRELILSCGYHGFQDWSLSVRKNVRGIPDCIRRLNEGKDQVDLEYVLEKLKKEPNKFAALIIDTGGSGIPNFDILSEIKDTCQLNGTVLIFDEIISGFRTGPRGVLGLSGIVPDLICFGKAVANGYPLSVLMGSSELLKLAPLVGMSSTFAGDCVALSAAKATLETLNNGNIFKKIQLVGEELIEKIRKSIKDNNLDDYLEITGYPALSKLKPKFLNTTEKTIKTYLMSIFAKEKIFWQGSFVLCRDFREKELNLIIKTIESAFRQLNSLLKSGSLHSQVESIINFEKKYTDGLKKEV